MAEGFPQVAEIFQKVSHNFPKNYSKILKKQSKVAFFLKKLTQKLLEKGEGFGSFLFLQKIHKLSTKMLWNIEERPIKY